MTETSGEKTCFIAMPVTTSKAHADLFGDPDHWQHVLEALFVPAVEAAGFTPWRPVAKGSHLIHAEIVRQLEEADMVLCDVSQNNPNVFFELGVRTSVNKPIALVRCDADVSIPFDVSGINTHTYNPSLKAWHIGAEVDALAAHVRDAETTCAGENPMWRQFGMTLKAQAPTSEQSREEALLSVLGQQMAQLSSRLEAIEPVYRAPDLDRDVLIVPASEASNRRDAVARRIESLAKTMSVPVDVLKRANGDGIVVRVRKDSTVDGLTWRTFGTEAVDWGEQNGVRVDVWQP